MTYIAPKSWEESGRAVSPLHTGVPVGHWKRPHIHYWHAAASFRPR